MSDIECFHTITFNLGTVFSRSGKIGYFPKKCDIYYFGWLFIVLQLSKHTKGLYKMNNTSILGFLNQLGNILITMART